DVAVGDSAPRDALRHVIPVGSIASLWHAHKLKLRVDQRCHGQSDHEQSSPAEQFRSLFDRLQTWLFSCRHTRTHRDSPHGTRSKFEIRNSNFAIPLVIRYIPGSSAVR